MSQALRDRPDHIQYLCSLLGLGRQQQPMTPVSGGFHHRVWRLETDSGVFAIKQLAPDKDLSDPALLRHYNATEETAAKFAKCGIGAIHALASGKDYLHRLDGEAYLVYPWTNASALERGRISRQHALYMARLLAQMHTAGIAVEGLDVAHTEIVSAERVEQLVNLAAERGLRGAAQLLEWLPRFRDIVQRQEAALSVLQGDLVISHGDLDQKNVLWNGAERAVIIDWESACWLNPTCEALLEALDWSGIASRFDRELFEAFLAAYQDAGGVLDSAAIEPALDTILGDWLDWLVYNVGRIVMVDDEEQHTIGQQQVEFVLPIILRLEQLGPRLKAIISKPTATRNAGA